MYRFVQSAFIYRNLESKQSTFAVPEIGKLSQFEDVYLIQALYCEINYELL